VRKKAGGWPILITKGVYLRGDRKQHAKEGTEEKKGGLDRRGLGQWLTKKGGYLFPSSGEAFFVKKGLAGGVDQEKKQGKGESQRWGKGKTEDKKTCRVSPC